MHSKIPVHITCCRTCRLRVKYYGSSCPSRVEASCVLLCAIKVVRPYLDNNICAPTPTTLYNNLFAPVYDANSSVPTMSLFTGNLRRSAGAGESLCPLNTQFFERTATVVRSRIYPHWDASPMDAPFEHAYVNILGWLCASANT